MKSTHKSFSTFLFAIGFFTVSVYAMDFPSAFIGNWRIVGSVAYFTIEVIDNEPVISTHSQESGKEGIISNVFWDEKTLSFTTHFLHTDYKVNHTLELIDENMIRDNYIGDNIGELIWMRE
jgi:hypothetical protein